MIPSSYVLLQDMTSNQEPLTTLTVTQKKAKISFDSTKKWEYIFYLKKFVATRILIKVVYH